MITPAAGVRIWLAAGLTDMRRGFDGLAALVQQHLGQDPFSGHLFVFRGKRGHLLKILFWDGQGLVLYAKRLERGRFVWPQAKDGVVALTPAQLSMLTEGIDWRMPVRTWQPESICATSAASCRPMAMPVTPDSMATGSSKRPAWRMRGANSSMCTRRPNLHLRVRHWTGLPRSIGSRRRSVAVHPTSACASEPSGLRR